MEADNKTACDVSNVILQVNAENQRQNEDTHQRRIKRVLHFSDGDLVEYDDDETDAPPPPHRAVVDPKTLDWLPWTWYQASWIGAKLLEGCDYVGEALANFFGITSPKYQFEINEYNRQQKAAAEEKRRQELELGGWTEQHRNNLIKTEQ